MSRIDDLIDLIQTANDIYLMNPIRNVRSAYIQIDDLCELVMKSFLQMNISNWSPHKNNNRGFKNFHEVTEEVLGQVSENHDFSDLLARIKERRSNRNHFFHDQNQIGLTVDDQNCLAAFLDLYMLASRLLGENFKQRLQANPVVQAQMTVVKLRFRGYQTTIAYNNYQQVLRDRGQLRLDYNSLGYEYCALYEDATRFLRYVRQHFADLITDCENGIQRIESLAKRTRTHQKRLNYLHGELSLLREIVEECLGGELQLEQIT